MMDLNLGAASSEGTQPSLSTAAGKAERLRNSPVNSNLMGSLIVLFLFGLIVYGLIVGIPYIYNRMTTP